MGVKYRLDYKAHDDVSWRVDILTDNYSADIIAIKGQTEQAATLSYNPENTDDPFSVFITSTLDINFINEGQVDMHELQDAQDKDFKAVLYRNGLLFWTGYLKQEDIQQSFLSPPYPVTISFLCGLGMLNDIPYTHNNLYGTTYTTVRNPINYIRNILFSQHNLGLALPVRWSNQLQCTAFTDDVFAGSVTWSPFGEGFYSYQQGTDGQGDGPYKSCGYILNGILKAMQCRIFQCRGKWVIRRINDLAQYMQIPYKEIDAGLDLLVIHLGTEDLSEQIGRSGYRMINENQVLTTKPGLKSFKTTYIADVRDNILPNGNQDILSIGSIIYWGSYEGLVIAVEPSLDGRDGASASLGNISGADKYYTLKAPGGVVRANGLPIDAFTQVKIINFGFTFSPKTGFNYNAGTGIIDWTNNPLQIMVVFNTGANRYYLNEFGFWVTAETFISITVDQLKIDDVAKVDFDKFQGIKIPQPPAEPEANDVCNLQVLFKVKAGQSYYVDNIYFQVDEANDVYEVFNDNSKNTSTDDAELTISSSFGGYFVSNFMTGWYNSYKECFFNDGGAYTGTLTGVHSHAVMRFRYKSSQIFNGDILVRNGNWSFDEIYTIDTLLGKKFLPLNAKYNTEKGEVSLVAIECRNDNIALRESFYSSNDNQDSN